MDKCPAKHHPTPPSAFTWRKLTPPKRVTRQGWQCNPPRWGTPPLMWKQSRKKERLYGEIGNPTKAGDLTYLGSPTFMWTGPNSNALLLKQWLTEINLTTELRRVLQHCGLPANNFYSHSFCTKVAAKAGLSPWLIKVLGRWRSNCYKCYISTPKCTILEVPNTRP